MDHSAKVEKALAIIIQRLGNANYEGHRAMAEAIVLATDSDAFGPKPDSVFGLSLNQIRWLIGYYEANSGKLAKDILN